MNILTSEKRRKIYFHFIKKSFWLESSFFFVIIILAYVLQRRGFLPVNDPYVLKHVAKLKKEGLVLNYHEF